MSTPWCTGCVDVAHWEWDNLHHSEASLDKALAAFKAAGGVIVWAKTTQGKDYVDPSWSVFVAAVRRAGLLLGAYHFGSNTSPGEQQAQWFMQHAQGADIYALDFEDNPDASHTMTVDQARAFCAEVFKVQGRHPVLYTGLSFICARVHDPHDPLGACPLWLAAYGPTDPKVPSCWEHWELFQFTDGTFGPWDQTTYPRSTPGFGHVDRSGFKGTPDELAQWVKNAGRPGQSK